MNIAVYIDPYVTDMYEKVLRREISNFAWCYFQQVPVYNLGFFFFFFLVGGGGY